MKQQHKHKKCMCKHKQKLESAFNGVTIIAGPALHIGGRRGSNVSSNADNDTEEKPSESRQFATNWWKLKLADRKAHNELMKIQLLSPFLFCKVYQGDHWVCVAKKAGFLSEKKIKSLDDLSDDEIHTTDLMEDTLAKLQERIIEYNNIKPSNKPIYAYLEEILDDIKAVEETFQLLKNPVDHVDTAIKIVYNKHWFKAVRKQLPAKYADKHDYAVFLVAWQVCVYIKSVYQEKPLDVYKKDSELDSDLEVHKQQGNEYFKNENYKEAIKTYTLMLLKKPYLYIIYGNRAACYLKIQQYRLALSDGRRAVALRPQWDKGQYRYAQALYELAKFDETLDVLSKAIKICSSAQLISLQKDVKRSVADKDHPSLWVDPHIVTVPKDSAKGNTNGEDVDEQRYANMPELETDNSDNEGESDHSDQETTVPQPKDDNKQLESKKEIAKKKKKKKSRKENQEKPAVPIPMKMKIMSVMQEASKYLLDSKIEFAVREYRKVFSMMQSDPLIITNKEVALLHYALGWAYQESSSTLLQDSLQEFAEIKRKYPDMNFPLSFYGKGIVYHKQNRFKECVVELQEALRLCNLTDCMLNCCWPGVDDIIEVSIPENFKLAVGHFITLCSHPPRPDAICRYIQCSYRATNIYYTDPDFKGFLRMICTENCFVEFHSSCWKKYKSEQDNHSGEKDFLSSPCLTPDCYGAVWSLQIYDNSKKITKEVNVKDLNSLKKELRQKELNANGAVVPDKKRKKESSICEDNAQHVSKEEKQKRSRKSSNLSDKGQDSDDFHKIKNAESANTIHGNENHSNSVLSDNLSSADYFRPSFDISKYNCITDVKSVALNIFTLFENLLKDKGSVDLGNGAENRNFMNSLDDNSKLLIVQAGSLRSLLNICPKFAFDTKNKNTVYLTTKQEEGKQKYEDPPLDLEKDVHDENISSCIDNNIDSTKTEIMPITSREKKNSESSDKDLVSESKPQKVEKTNETVAISTQSNNDSTSKNAKSSKSTNNTPSVNNGSKSSSETEISDDMEVIDCTKSNTDIFAIKSGSKTKKQKKKVSDIIIFNDAKKGGDITCKVIRSPDGLRPEPVSPRKKEKSKGKGYKKIDDHVYKLKHDRPLTPPGEKSNLRTYLEDKIEAEKNNKTPKYCCPLLGNNCSCAEIEKFCDEDGGKTRVRVMKVITIEPEGKESDSDEDSNQAVANALELIHSRNANGNQRRKRSSSCENMCVVEVGIQCDLTNLKKVECDKEKLKMFNEDLIKRLKESQTLNEKLSLEFEKYKEEQTLVIDNKNAENKSHKSSLEKLRKEISLTKSTTQDEVKKVKEEVENEYLTKVESLSKRIESLDKEKRDWQKEKCDLQKEKRDLQLVINDKTKTEVEQKSNLVRRDRELRTKDEEIKKLKTKAEELKTKELKTKTEELKTKDDEIKSLKTTREILLAQIEEIKQEHAQEKLSHEEIVNGFTNSITEQCNRTQKVQIAFLEVKKEIVAVKYQQQAAIVQNTINQMQFWPMVPEVQNIRSVWDDFKKHFQSCYEKMQEEFRTVIKKVKEGDPLEELPPAQYAEPPPFPKTPMPSNVPIQSPYFGQPVAPPMANPSAAQSVCPPAPPPGITVPANRPAVALNLETSSPVDSPAVASPVTSTSPVSNMSSDETSVSVKSTVSSSISDSSSSEHISISKSNSSQAAPVTSLPSSFTTPKSSVPSNETKILSFASSVKQGFGSDHQTFSSSTVSLKGAPKHVDSSGSSECEDPDEPRRKMFDRIIMRLGSIFPSFSREELRFYVVEYRRMQPQGSLSGMKFDELIMNLEKMIRAMKDAAKAPPKTGADVSSQRKKIGESDAANRAPAKRTRASHTPNKISSQESSWSGTASKSIVSEGYGQEEPCVICYEDMAKESVSKLHCGHIFHRSCITCWLNEQRTCPICRVHALLPEEFPTLG